MKRSTMLGILVCLLSLTMGAQITQKPTASLEDLLVRYENIGKQAGAVSDFFSPEEQRMLQAYFSEKKPIGPANNTNNSGTQQPTDVKSMGENNPVFYNGRSNAQPIEQIKGLSPQIYGQELQDPSPLRDANMQNWNASAPSNFALPFSLEVQEELLADQQYRANLPANYVPTVTPANRAPMVDWIPT